MKRLLSVILALLVGLFIYWFLANHELVEKEYRSGYSPQARLNHFLAAERFLTATGRDARSLRNPELWRGTGPRAGETLLFRDFYWPSNTDHRKRFITWLKGGGHIILEAPLASELGMAHFLAELGVTRERTEGHYSGETVTLEGQTAQGSVTFAGSWTLVINEEYGPPLTYELSNEKAIYLVQMDYGQGLITLLSDISPFLNHNIGDEDHAWALTQFTGDEVTLLYSVDSESLPALLWRYAREAVIALLLLALLLMWAMGQRLGPLLPALGMRRRSLSEHLSANAAFLWRVRQGKRLFQDNQQRLEQAWLAKHYLLRNMDLVERCQWIAERSGLTQVQVDSALYGDFQNEREFIELSAYQQVLRNAL